jgi:hypothetical protein
MGSGCDVCILLRGIRVLMVAVLQSATTRRRFRYMTMLLTGKLHVITYFASKIYFLNYVFNETSLSLWFSVLVANGCSNCVLCNLSGDYSERESYIYNKINKIYNNYFTFYCRVLCFSAFLQYAMFPVYRLAVSHAYTLKCQIEET